MAAFNLASLFTGRDGHALNLPRAAELLRCIFGHCLDMFLQIACAGSTTYASHPEAG